jgi:hypothetical protein
MNIKTVWEKGVSRRCGIEQLANESECCDEERNMRRKVKILYQNAG